MSVEGTGLAAGLAQTTHAAQQVGRGRDKAGRDEGAQFKQTLQRVDQLNRTAQTSDADEELPDRQAPGYENPRSSGGGKSGKSEEDPEASAEGSPPSDGPPYQHIDIRA